MEQRRYRYGPLLACAAAVVGLVLASSTFASAASQPGNDYVLTSPTLSIDDVSMSEGNVGATVFAFTINLGKMSPNPTTVSVQTADGTATVANSDYLPVSTVLVIPANTLTATVNVVVNVDNMCEQDETFTVNLSNPIGGTIADGTGLGTILNDDNCSPCLTIDDVTQAEGNLGKSFFVFTVSLSNPTDQVVTVDYNTADGTATLANNDYQQTSGTLTFPAKSMSTQQIAVPVNGDLVSESDEVFLVLLSNALGGAVICDGSGIGTILDDEVTATLLSRFEAEAIDDGIELRWQFGDASSVASSWVERADAVSGPWARIDADVQTDGGVLAVVDRGVESNRTYQYRLAIKLANGRTLTTAPLSANSGDLVKEFALSRVAPNPTSGPATINLAVARQARVKLSVLDVQGRVVAVLVDGVLKAGRHQVTWSGEALRGRAAAGVYFVRYEVPGQNFVKRIVLTR